jgi:hypothetical protein
MHDPNCPCSAHDPNSALSRRIQSGAAANRLKLAQIIGTGSPQHLTDQITLDHLTFNINLNKMNP